METGTIKDLDLKPGDVVECIYGAFDMWKVGERYTMTADGLECEYKVPQSSSLSKFRIISRASDDTPKPWRDMTDEERANIPAYVLNDPTNPLQIPWGEWTREAKKELLLAKHEGKEIEEIDPFDPKDDWESFFYFDDFDAFRVKPEPVRETVAFYTSGGEGWAVFNEYTKFDTHRITFDLIDGEPDLDSIKMEEA